MFHLQLFGGIIMEEITALDLKRRLDAGEDLQIVDVREANEVAFCSIPGTVHIPLGQVTARMSEIDPARETIIHCKLGGRSAKAIGALKQAGFTGQLVNLAGGIMAWSNDVDPSVPKY
jgi:adenylyltransferase/sulfurtransferase